MLTINTQPLEAAARQPYVDLHPRILPAFTSFGSHTVVCWKCGISLLESVWHTQVAGFGIWCPGCGAHCKVPHEALESD